MTKQAGYYFKVGLAVIIALGVFVATAIFLDGWFNRQFHITALFDDAHGVQKGDNVFMAGVQIGEVESVSLTKDNKAKVILTLHKDFPIPTGSVFNAKGALLGTSSGIMVDPAKSDTYIPDGATVVGNSSDPITEALESSKKLVGSAEVLMGKFGATADSINKMIGDPKLQNNLKETAASLKETAANLPKLQNQIQQSIASLSGQANKLLLSIDETRNHADQVILSSDHLMHSLDTTVNENRGTIRTLLHDADDAASSVAGLTDQLKATLGNKDIQQHLVDTTKNLDAMSAKLDATAADLQKLADDPKLNEDVRATVTNIRETTESARNLAARLEGVHIPGEKRNKPETPHIDVPFYFSSDSLLEPGLVFDSVYDTKVERFRFDGNYTLLAGKPGAFYRAGVYDATYRNRLDLEAGQGLFGNKFDYRYGVIAGKLGIGFDTRTGPFDFRLDAYDPNHGTVNARAKVNLNASSAITAGVDSLGAGNHATVGIQIRR